MLIKTKLSFFLRTVILCLSINHCVHTAMTRQGNLHGLNSKKSLQTYVMDRGRSRAWSITDQNPFKILRTRSAPPRVAFYQLAQQLVPSVYNVPKQGVVPVMNKDEGNGFVVSALVVRQHNPYPAFIDQKAVIIERDDQGVLWHYAGKQAFYWNGFQWALYVG